LVRPALTTVAQAPSDLCRSAVDALLSIMSNAAAGVPPPQIMATHLVVRASCGAVS
jgi:DNA-binding LacI/PurR family transcriptional regulator